MAEANIDFDSDYLQVFPLLTVRENLESGFAAIREGKRTIPDEVFELFR